MTHINYDGHLCSLIDAPPAVEDELKQTLQYVNTSEMGEHIQRYGLTQDQAREKATHFMYKNGYFLSGYLPRVKKILKAHGVKPTVTYLHDAPEFVDYDFDELLHRLELDKVEHQVDLLETLKTKNRGIIWIPTAGGKAFSAAFEINYFPNAKILVTVPKEDLQVQLMDTLSLVLNEPIGKLGGKGKNKMERVTVATLQTASKKPELLENIQVWVADECHEMPEMQEKISAAMPQCAIRFGFTATPKRKDGAHFKIEGIQGPIIYKTTRSELEENGFILKPSFYNVRFVHEDTRQIPFSNAISIGSSGYIYHDRFGRLSKPNEAEHHVTTIMENHDRNDMIIELFTSFLEWPDRTGPGAIFTGRVGHAEALARRLRDLKYDAFAISAPRNKAERELQKEVIKKARCSDIDAVIAADILNTGTDIRTLQFALMAESCANHTIITQRIGRILRSPRNGEVKSGAYVVFIEDDEYWWLNARAGKAKEFIKTEFPDSPMYNMSVDQFKKHFLCSQKQLSLTGQSH